MYTVARVYLRLSEDEFWNLEPRRFVVLVNEWKDAELYAAKRAAYLNMGGTIDDEEDSAEYFDVSPDAF